MERPEIYIIFICQDESGRVLLGKRAEGHRDEPGRYDIGSCHFLINENPISTFKKAVVEEYGALTFKNEYLGFREGEKIVEGKRVNWTGLDFRVIVSSNFFKLPKTEKINAYMWASLNNFPINEEVHSQLPSFLEKYKDKLRIKKR